MALAPEEAERLVRRFNDAYNRGDYDGAARLTHPQVEFIRSWEASVLRGRDAARAWMEPEVFEDQRIELLDLAVVGEKVLARQRYSATGAGSGIGVDVESWAIFTLDDAGLIIRTELFLHHEADRARAAAGLDPKN